MRRPATTMSTVLALATMLLANALPARAGTQWGIHMEGGGFTGGRLWRADAGQSREWIVPDGSTSYFGEQATAEMQSYIIGGGGFFMSSDAGWGLMGRLVFSAVDVDVLVRDGLDEVRTEAWDIYTTIDAHLAGTWTFAPQAANSPYVLAGFGLTVLGSEGSAADQSSPSISFGGGWRFWSGGWIFDIEVRDTIVTLDFDDEEARLRERVLPEDGFDAESSVHLLEATLRWGITF